MENTVILETMAAVVSGGIAGVFAILLWPRTRDPAWMLVVAGAVVNYGGLVYRALEAFGIAGPGNVPPEVALAARLVFYNLPYVLYSLGFLVRYLRKE